MPLSVLLSTAYLPPLQHFSKMMYAERVVIDHCEYFEKQSYRSRCTIYGANGGLDLIVPLEHGSEKTRVDRKRISYVHPWRNLHWKSICSAYRSAPYFEYFEAEFEDVYKRKHEFLTELNMDLIQLIFRLLKHKTNVEFTTAYEKHPVGLADFRSLIHPKQDPLSDPSFAHVSYSQVFIGKRGFLPNLSILDLLFNEGLNTAGILRKSFVETA